MKKNILITLFLFTIGSTSAQHNAILDTIINKFEKSTENNVYFNNEPNGIDKEKVLSHFEFLKKINTELNKFTGKINFSFKLKDSESQEQTDLSIGAKISKGVFPGEINFNSLLNVQLLNGKFIENVSNLAMSYDHHLDNDIDTEAYIFLRRSSNNFLNIDQRYEVGAGFTFNFYSGEYATKEKYEAKKLDKSLKENGVENFKKLLAFNSNTEKILEGTYAPFCEEDDCKKNEITDKESKAFNKLYQNITTGIRKKESLWRASLLTGLNYEIERTNDSLKLRYRDSTEVRFFEPKKLIRIVIGPKVEAQINELEFESVCYFKLGFFNDNLEDEIINEDSDPILRDARTDYRIEWSTKASIKVSKKISVSGTLMYTWINAPRRQYFEYPSQTNNLALFSSDQRYLNFTAGLEYNL